MNPPKLTCRSGHREERYRRGGGGEQGRRRGEEEEEDKGVQQVEVSLNKNKKIRFLVTILHPVLAQDYNRHLTADSSASQTSKHLHPSTCSGQR